MQEQKATSEQRLENAKERLKDALTNLDSLIRKQNERLKDEEAKMLGFANFAALSLAPKMAKTVSEVDQFLTDFAKRAQTHGQKDWEELQHFAKEHLGLSSLEPWDMAFASEQLKQVRYAFSENEVKQYFPLPKVLDGLFGLVQTLFGVKIEKDSLPVWHTDVQS
jgi:oligopeptidase A